MGWYSDAVDAITGGSGDVKDFLDSDLISGIAQGAIGSQLNKYFQPDVPKVGYQGKIPEMQAVRERVPMQQPVEGQAPRRPGEAGRRYFSDTQYAERPDTKPQSVAEAQAKAQAQAQQLAQRQNPQPPTGMAAGGIASAHNGYYLGGKTDGMADDVPARIDGTQEARLSDGEFVIPADVVSHLGNGNSDAGSQQLYGMMDNIREARTGNPEQGKRIDPNKFIPNMAQGGITRAYNYGGGVKTNFPDGGDVDTSAAGALDGVNDTTGNIEGNVAGKEASLSSWAGDYVTDMLGQGKALGNQAYQGYEGPLSASTNELQDKSFTGIGGLTAPENMGAYTPQTFGAEQATAGMNPYLMASLNPQLDEARRQSEIDRVANAGRMTQAGAFGGSRQALMDMENQRNLETNLADITGKGYASAYDRAQQQFNTQQDRNMKAQNEANQYGFDVLGGYGAAGATQRGIEQQGLSADKSQFEEERDFPYKQVQYMQSLLQGLPLEAQSYSYSQPSDLQNLLGSTAGVKDIMQSLYGSSGPPTTAQTGAAMGLTAAEILAGTVGYGDAADELASIPEDY